MSDILYQYIKRVVDNKEVGIIVAGTGRGKTYNSAKIALELIKQGKKVVYISHFLVSHQKFGREFEEYGLPVYVYSSLLSDDEKREVKEIKSGLIICTIEALLSNMKEFLDNTALVIIDEVHLVDSVSYRDAYYQLKKIIDECKKRKIAICGLTATPYPLEIFKNFGFEKVYNTGLKSAVNVQKWYFVRIKHLKSVLKRSRVDIIKHVYDIVKCMDYNAVMVYCNNTRYANVFKDSCKIVCSDIKNAFMDLMYNNERFFKRLIDDNIGNTDMYCTESVVNGINIKSVNGKIACIVVIDDTNSVINAIQFVSRFRKATIDVYCIMFKPKLKDPNSPFEWFRCKTFNIDSVKEYVDKCFNDVEFGFLEIDGRRIQHVRRYENKLQFIRYLVSRLVNLGINIRTANKYLITAFLKGASKKDLMRIALALAFVKYGKKRKYGNKKYTVDYATKRRIMEVFGLDSKNIRPFNCDWFWYHNTTAYVNLDWIFEDLDIQVWYRLNKIVHIQVGEFIYRIFGISKCVNQPLFWFEQPVRYQIVFVRNSVFFATR